MKEIKFHIDDDGIHHRIKRHSEIDWTNIIRESMINHLSKTT